MATSRSRTSSKARAADTAAVTGDVDRPEVDEPAGEQPDSDQPAAPDRPDADEPATPDAAPDADEPAAPDVQQATPGAITVGNGSASTALTDLAVAPDAGVPSDVATAPDSAPLAAPPAATGPNVVLDPTSSAAAAAATAAEYPQQRKFVDRLGEPLDVGSLVLVPPLPATYRTIGVDIYEEKPAAGSYSTKIRTLVLAAGAIVGAAEADALVAVARAVADQ